MAKPTAPKQDAPKLDTPKSLASFAAVNASLSVVLLDSKLVAGWEPLDPDDDGDDVGGHPQKVIDLLGSEGDDDDDDSDDDDDDGDGGLTTHAELEVGDGEALVVVLEGGTGEAEVYRLPDGTLILAEPPRSWWDDPDNHGKKKDKVAALFAKAIAQPGRGADELGAVEVPSGKLVMFDSNADLTPAAEASKAKGAVGEVTVFGEDEAGVIATVKPGSYVVRRQMFEVDWSSAELVVAYIQPE